MFKREYKYFVVINMINGNCFHTEVIVYDLEELFNVILDLFGTKIKSVFYTEAFNVVKKVF